MFTMKSTEKCVNKVRISTKTKHEKVPNKNHRSKNIKTELKNSVQRGSITDEMKQKKRLVNSKTR